MPDNVITIEFQGDQSFIDAVSYNDALGSFLALLREIDGIQTRQAGATGHSLRWLIQALRSSTPTAELFAESVLEDVDVGPQTISMALDSLSRLQTQAIRPPELTFAGLERCQDLGAILRRDSIRELIVSSDHTEVHITERLDVNVREIMGQKVEVMGSVEGELDMATRRGRRYFNVYSSVTGKATRCYFQESMQERVRDALFHIVVVKGTLRSLSHEEGQEMVEITDLQIVTADENLPTPDEIRGIMPNLTGGKPSERYLKERWRGNG